MTSGFYEDDEPLADVIRAFEQGEKGETGMNNDLVTRVRAAMDEAERLANEAAAETRAEWDDGGEWGQTVTDLDGATVAAGPDGTRLYPGVRGHIALHDPKGELRKVAADRRLLDHAVAHCAKYDERVESGDQTQIEHGAAMYEIVVQLAAGYGIELPEVTW